MNNQKSKYYEKTDSVLWAATPEGIVLHNFCNQRYFELTGLSHQIWMYLDGAHDALNIREKILQHYEDSVENPPANLDQVIAKLTQQLLEQNFIQEVVTND
jgi:hypothetical protein